MLTACNDCLWKLCLYLDFLIDCLVDIYEIFNINNSSNLDYQMWFKQGISLDDSNFDMENYSSLVDVKLLLKRILDSYWNKPLCKFCITVHCFHARVQSSTCATYQRCNNGRANSEIGYTTDCLYSFCDWQKKLNSVCWNYVHFSHQPLISVAQKRSFPKSNEMHRFITFMRINQDDDDIDYKCYAENLLRCFNKNIARERIDKRFEEFCYFGLLKIVII